MISLPPGCSVAYSITIDVSELTSEMCDWYEQIGGTVTKESHWDYRGRQIDLPYVSYNHKRCYHRKDGSKGVRLHFLGKDAAVASMFLIKFMEYVEQHNLKEHNNLYDQY